MNRKPKIMDAVLALVGGSVSGPTAIFSKIKYESGQTPPTEKEANAKLVSMIADWESIQYQRDRIYPDIGEQLDLLYHDMTSGKNDKTGEWYKAISKVKTDNPKSS